MRNMSGDDEIYFAHIYARMFMVPSDVSSNHMFDGMRRTAESTPNQSPAVSGTVLPGMHFPLI